MFKVSLEKEKRKKDICRSLKIAKSLKSVVKTTFLQIFYKYYKVGKVVTLNNIIRRFDKNVQNSSC